MELLDRDQRPCLDIFADVEELVDLVRVGYVITVLVFKQLASTLLFSRRFLVTGDVRFRFFIVSVVGFG